MKINKRLQAIERRLNKRIKLSNTLYKLNKKTAYNAILGQSRVYTDTYKPLTQSTIRVVQG